MIVYLAGGVSGNLIAFWRNIISQLEIGNLDEERAMRLYLAGMNGRHWIHDDCKKTLIEYKPFILESFYYADEVVEKLIPHFGDFLLDSGAFTFLSNSKEKIDWEGYIDRYADFINRNGIEKFFELDIDPIVGYKKVLEFRERLENLTNKQCIPVWHKSRGIDEYKRMCDEYAYAAIGGIITKEIKLEHYHLFPHMITEAHKRRCKIHGLGFSHIQKLDRYHFDSIDSTTWTTGNRFGFIFKFNGKTMERIFCPRDKRINDPRQIAIINFKEWLKFQKYAEANL